MGIHNEPGFERLSPLPSLSQLISQMFQTLTSTTDPERSFLPFKGDGQDEVVLLVNNLGSVSELEMGAVVREGTTKLHAVIGGIHLTAITSQLSRGYPKIITRLRVSLQENSWFVV
jgi:triose/dihydroxyacetone kinase / FAD-AMP lyase (cyclizing)